MRIRTQFIITILLFGMILVVVAAWVIMTGQQVEKAGEQEKIANDIAQGASELGYLSNDFLIYRESQQLKRWQSRFASFSAQVASLRADRPEQLVLVHNIQANQQRLKEVFDSVASGLGNPPPNQRAALDAAFLQVSWSRMAVQSQALVSDASRLSQLLRYEMAQLIETRTMLMYVMVGCLGLFLLVSYVLTYRRILKAIATLQAGTAIIGSGNLEFVIEEKRNDEIGDLSRAFNRMTTDLKAVTASKSDLEREIAERKQAEESLREAHERVKWLARFPEQNPNPIIRASAEGTVLYCNPASAKLHGWTCEVGQLLQNELLPLVGRAIAEGREVEQDVQLAERFYVVWIVPFPDERYTNIYGRDITERRRVQESLRQSEKRYRSYIEVTEQLGWSTDADGEVVEDIPSWRKFTGQSDEEVKGWGWSKALHPDDLEHTSRVWRNAVATRNKYEVEYRIRRYDAVYRHFLARGVPVFKDDGDILEWVGTCVDITERKQAEEALRENESRLNRAQEIAHLGSWELDLVNNRLAWSDEVYRIFGLQPQEFGATYEAFLEAVHPDDRAAVDAAYSDSVREGRDTYEIEHRVVRKSTGETRIVHERCEHIRDASGRIIRSIGMVHDITERKRTEEALRRAHEELQEHAGRLEAANKELESFGYSVSHDLRSPLRAIAGFTRMILDEKGATFDPETRRKFGVIQENAEKMGQLIDDLLRLSRLGRAELHRSKLDMGGLVREVIQEIRMTEPEWELVTEIGDLPAAHGDRVMVRQLLANLLSNAVKFTRGKQGARIEVGSFERSGEQVYYVKDNGVGFDMKYYNKLFGVFQRLVSASQFEGTGVGLAIVQRIVQRHGGRVWAEGQMQGGATFYFTLPQKEQG